jgi:sugar lactone lactonase YvrE
VADGARGIARFSNPTNVAIASDGTTYSTDYDGSRLRAIDGNGTTQTIISKTGFTHPFGLAFAPNGTLYVQTDDNDTGERSETTGTVWKVDTAAKTAVVVAKNLGRPRGLAVLGDGRIAMADYIHHVVSILDPTNGSVTPLAGAADQMAHVNATGDQARFNKPYHVVVLSSGDLAVTDYGNHRVRQVTLAGVVTDLAGTDTPGADDGPIATATFDQPQGLAVSGTTLYVSDTKTRLIRKIEGGQVSTLAGDGTAGMVDSDDPRKAKFYGLEGIAVDATRVVAADGNIGDGSDFNRIRLVHLP